MPKGTSQAEVMSNSEKIKPKALAIVKSEGIIPTSYYRILKIVYLMEVSTD